jgi:hypothetical protein
MWSSWLVSTIAGSRGDGADFARSPSDRRAAVTNLLKKAFEEAAKLPPAEQDDLAAELLEWIAAEERWDESLESSADVLESLADEALEEYRADGAMDDRL